ncbi:hypothetical protein EGT07_24530 [Herbaspirillum sp. HC18]|nr:hypothetical protein EGT07_24530 [Herbaspirillum sp. HC18]
MAIEVMRSYFEPEPLVPLEPVPEEEPGLPEEELEVPPPLEPELWSPARRSQPTAVRLRAVTISKIFEVVLSASILVPFMKSQRSLILDRSDCDKFLIFSQSQPSRQHTRHAGCSRAMILISRRGMQFKMKQTPSSISCIVD